MKKIEAVRENYSLEKKKINEAYGNLENKNNYRNANLSKLNLHTDDLAYGVRRASAITLIALVITIIILLILAAVTVAMLTGENGILNRAKNSGEATKQAEAVEDVKLKITEAQTKAYSKGETLTLEYFVDYLASASVTDEYNVTLKSGGTSSLKSGSKTGIEVASENSIIVTNTRLGYGVEVRKNLTIANDVTYTGTTSGGSGGQGTSGVAGGNNGIVNESSKIIGLDFEAKDIYSTKIIFSVTVDASCENEVAAYYVLCNNKVKKVSEQNEFEVNDLQYNTKYNFKIGVLDVDGNIKFSQEKEISTLSFMPVALDYPIITADGVKNASNDTGTEFYFFDNMDITSDRGVRN